MSIHQEQARLANLRSFDIFDTPPERVYDEIVQLTTRLLGVPGAIITLVGADTQYFKAGVGLKAGTATPTDTSFCKHTISQTDLTRVFMVKDATQDERFRHFATVTGPPSIRFYAGAALVSADGFGLGALCVYDSKPRVLSAEQQETLSVLSRAVMAQLEIRRATERLRSSEERHRLALDAMIDAIILIDENGNVQYWNFSAESIFGIAEHDAIGRPLHKLIAPEVESFQSDYFLTLAEDLSRFSTTHRPHVRLKRAMDETFPAHISAMPLKTRAGTIYSICVRDLAERKRQEFAAELL